MMTERAKISDWARMPCTAFSGSARVATGELREVALRAKELLDADRWAGVLIVEDASARTVEVDFRGTPEEVQQRLDRTASPWAAPRADETPPETAPTGPGRPKLGVVAREVTLLPRHWEWLGRQPGGASVALRKLVEAARRDDAGRERVRLAQEAAYRFMSVMAGNMTGMEEATRALFAADRERFETLTESWPPDVREYTRKLAEPVFGDTAAGSAGGEGLV